jgi:D-glycero-D-manno-heptose 1,7-bisphosphate phosphatase
MSKRSALFLDRDGVINVDRGYVHRREDFEFLDGIFDVVRTACRAGHLVVIITNQAGIGRGYYGEDDFHLLMDWVVASFRAREGDIHGVYFCPDHPEHGIGPYRRHSNMRKPGPGMFLRAAREMEIDLSRSYLIGDKLSDIKAGAAAGIPAPHLFLLGKDIGPTFQTLVSLTDIIPLLEETST